MYGDRDNPDAEFACAITFALTGTVRDTRRSQPIRDQIAVVVK
jgi:hypothetical protein